MSEQVVLGLAGGLLGALLLSLWFAAITSKSVLGMLLAVGMATAQVLTTILDIPWTPDAGAAFALVGIDGNAELAPAGVSTLVASMLCFLAAAWFGGFIRRLARCIDRIGAALGARRARPRGPGTTVNE